MESICRWKSSPLGASRKTRLFCARPRPLCPPNRQNFLRDGHHRWPTCQASARNARVTLLPRIGAAVSAAIPGTRCRARGRCPRPARPSLAVPAAPLSPNPLPLQRLGAAELSSCRPAWIKTPPTLSSSAPCATFASNCAKKRARPRHHGRPDRGAVGRSERAARASNVAARRIALAHGHAHARDD